MPGGETESQPTIRGEGLALLILVAVGAALRLWNLDLWPGFSGDEGRDVFYSWQIAEHGVFGLHPVRPYFGPWQLWLMAPFIKLMGVGALSSRLPLALLGVAAIPLAAAVGRRLGGPPTALAAAALTAVLPLTVLFSRLALSVSALPALLLGAWWAWQRLVDRPGRVEAALLGFFLGAAVSFHPQALALGVGIAVSMVAVRSRLRSLLRVDLLLAALAGFAVLGWVSWDVILDQVGLGPTIDYSGTWVDEAPVRPLWSRLAQAGPITVDVLAGGRLLHWIAGPSSADPPGELLCQLLVVLAFGAALVRTARARSPEALALALAVGTIWLLTVVRAARFDLSGLSRERYLLTTLVLATPWLAWGLVGAGKSILDRIGATLLVGLVLVEGAMLGSGFFGTMARTGGDAEPSFVASTPDVKVAAAGWMGARLAPGEEGLLLAGDSWSHWPVVAMSAERFPADYVPADPAECAHILRTRAHRRRWLMDFAGWHWNDEIRDCLGLVGRSDMPPTFVGEAQDGRPLLLIWELPPEGNDATL